MFAYKENNGIYIVTYGSSWSYEISSDTWTEISKNNFDKNSYSVHAIGFYLNGSAYVLEDGQHLYKYYPDLYRWVKSGRYPGCQAEESIKTVFVIGDEAYIATTFSKNVYCAPYHVSYRDW